MILLIDGYNLLKHVFSKVKGRLDKQRDLLIKQLAYYKSKKSDGIKQIILVFDGGLVRHATREVRSGIVVIFSGQQIDADQWILNYVEKHRNEELMLASADKELVESAKKFGCDSISVFDFYSLVKNCLQQDTQKDLLSEQHAGDIIKYDKTDKIFDKDFKIVDHEALDLLMEQASLSVASQKDENYGKEKDNRRLKGISKKLPKKKRKLQKKLKKLK